MSDSPRKFEPAPATVVEPTPPPDRSAVAPLDLEATIGADGDRHSADFVFDTSSLSLPLAPSRGSNDGTLDIDDLGARKPAPDTVREDPAHRSGRLQTGLADYEFISEIARGGMGVVFKARQRSLNRLVALKMILGGQLATSADVARFRTEAEAAAHLQHPNIVAIYEVGETGGHHFFSMQYVAGRSLSEVIRDKPPQASEAAQCLRTIALAVEYAHEQGILHRDLKPSNVLIDDRGAPHLTDFGVAKQLRADSQLTATGAVIGTPSYMPPEQASGSKGLGRTADVYSLGAILYELLTGRPPFTAQWPADVLMQVLTVEPLSPRVLNPSAPVDLATICLKCLEKDPGRRYPTAAALAADLDRWLKGQPIEARPIGRLERLWRTCKRSPVVASLTALLILVAIGAFVGVTSQWLVAQAALRDMQQAQRERASAQVDALLKSSPESLTPILQNLQDYYAEVAPELRRLLNDAGTTDGDRLRLSLALLPGDPSQLDFLREQLLSIGYRDVPAVRRATAPYHQQLNHRFWKVVDDATSDAGQRFLAALLLAGHQRADATELKRWTAHAPFLSEQLTHAIGADPSAYDALVETLRPLRQELFDSLAALCRDESQTEAARVLATNIFVSYAADEPTQLARLLVDGDPWQFSIIRPHLNAGASAAIEVLQREVQAKPRANAADDEKDIAARRRATAAVALVQLGAAENAWPLLVHSDDPRARSFLIEQFSELATDPALLVARLAIEQDVSARRALALALGSFAPQRVPEAVRVQASALLTTLCASDPDAGLHSACEWALARWGQPLPTIEKRESSPLPAHWMAGPQGHTLVTIDGGASFTMGSPTGEDKRSVAEKPHPMTIGRKYALATKEVTVEQFRRFSEATNLKLPPFTRKHSPEETTPMIMVTWYRAAQYCRWLSEQAGMSEDQMCYPPVDQIDAGLNPYPDYLQRTGFRLPTEAEWEFACRAGASTSRSYGSSDDLLAKYAWYAVNSADRAWPVGSLKPNDFGLFDMHGNAWEWCAERWASYWQSTKATDEVDTTPVDEASNRVLRGGSFDSAAKSVRSAFRDRFEKPHFGSDEIGFRVARTLAD